MKKRVIIIIFIFLMFLISIYIYKFCKSNSNTQNLNNKTDNEITENISTTLNSNVIKEVTFNKDESYAIELNDNLDITKGGIYILTGTITNGRICINTEDNVKLILNNIKIINTEGPCIVVENAQTVYIETSDKSENYLEDGKSYNLELYSEIDSCIFSKDNLVLTGNGKLTIIANYKDGIASKDNLQIDSGEYYISSKDDGIRGKDSLVINGGKFDIFSESDAIKSTNDTDENLGSILITDGIFNLTSESDGISSINDLKITSGTFNITSGKGYENASKTRNIDNFRNFILDDEVDSETDEISKKAIKSESNIIIQSGNFYLNSADDAIHSNNYIGIQSGDFEIYTGDDGIHADSKIIIDNGNVNIKTSYEGIEAENIVINNGIINIKSEDDGINVCGGMDNFYMFREKQIVGTSSINENSNSLQINGGNIYVNSSGDGLDANGNIYVNGGTTVVNGPTNSGNASLDYDRKLKITSGILIASGSSGMSQNASDTSTQNSIMINFEESIKSGELISIFDDSGNEIFTYSASKEYSNIIISIKELEINKKYLVYKFGESSSECNNGIYEIGNYKNGELYKEVILENVITNINKNGLTNNIPPHMNNNMENPDKNERKIIKE